MSQSKLQKFSTNPKDDIINIIDYIQNEKYINAFNSFYCFSKHNQLQLLSISSSQITFDNNKEGVSKDDKSILMSIFILNIIKIINKSDFLDLFQSFRKVLYDYLHLQKKDSYYYLMILSICALPIRNVLNLKNHNISQKYINIICSMLEIKTKMILFNKEVDDYTNIISIDDINKYHEDYNQLISFPIEVISIMKCNKILNTDSRNKTHFSFAKKENLNKLIIRRFLRYLKSNKDKIIENTAFISINKSKNPSLQCFKSVNSSYLSWLFSIDNVKVSFNLYLSFCLDDLLKEFNEKYDISHEDNINLREYLLKFSSLYSNK